MKKMWFLVLMLLVCLLINTDMSKIKPISVVYNDSVKYAKTDKVQIQVCGLEEKTNTKKTVRCSTKSECKTPAGGQGRDGKSYYKCGRPLGNDNIGYVMECTLYRKKCWSEWVEIQRDCLNKPKDECITYEEYEKNDGYIDVEDKDDPLCTDPSCEESDPIPKPEPVPTNCPYNISWGDGYCESELEYFSEIEDYNDWSCVFNDSYKLETELGDLGSDSYCPVYCVEEFRAETGQDPVYVEAGKHFEWPIGNNRSLSGARQCKAKDVYWTRFDQELKQANKDILYNYAMWQLAEKEVDYLSNKNGTDYSCSNCCNCYYVYDDDGEITDVTCTENYAVIYSHVVSYDGYIDTTPTFASCSSDPGADVSAQMYEYIYQLEWDIEHCLIPTYERSCPIPEILYKRMVSCYTNWNDDDIYYVDPIMSITYEGDNGNQYSYSDDLNVDVQYDATNLNFECTDTSVEVRKSYDQIETKDIKQCTKLEGERQASIFYSLKDELYRYVDKETGESFHASQLKQFLSEPFQNYYDIGYGNFPVSYATLPMTYGYSTGVGELSIHFDNYGHLDEKNTSSQISKIIDNDASKNIHENYRDMLCEYTVTKGIACANGNCGECIGPNCSTNQCTTKECTEEELEQIYGKRVIYRPIDLTDPFPSIEGDGRHTGANWCSGTDCSNDNNVVESVVLENRKVTSDEVYNLEPMYSFTLTPSIINQIREYNRTMLNEGRSYDDTNMTCDPDNKGNNVLGKHCISDYLTTLIQNTAATGTCSGLERRTNFDSCRY